MARMTSARRASQTTREVLTRTLDVFGDAWAFLVLQEAFFGVHRFVDFHEKLRMPRATLIARLRLLVTNGLLERSPRDESPRESYRLTSAGRDHYGYALALTRFGDRWLRGGERRPVRLRHGCGHYLGAEPHCRGCGTPLAAADVRFDPTPPPTSTTRFERKTRASADRSAYLRGRTTSVARTLSEVGDRWSLLIVYETLRGPRRFDDFVSALGVAPNILADRLRHLTAGGFLSSERRRREARSTYRLTNRGKALYEVVLALLGWGCRWLDADPADRPRHRCARPAEPTYRCRACGKLVRPADVTVFASASSRSKTPRR
jgi:DNA-binding HxlR family transcriptional regulator